MDGATCEAGNYDSSRSSKQGSLLIRELHLHSMVLGASVRTVQLIHL